MASDQAFKVKNNKNIQEVKGGIAMFESRFRHSRRSLRLHIPLHEGYGESTANSSLRLQTEHRLACSSDESGS
jgi:hypothetical protein